MEELNVILKAQQAIKSQFPKHSKEYQEALKNELQLEQERLKLMQNQTAELQKAYGVLGATSLLQKMLYVGEYMELLEAVQELSGLDADINDDIEEVKN